MANYITLKTAIQTAIKTNGNNEITGKILQQQLLATINSLGSDYQLAGTLRPADTPKTDDQRIVYLAVEPGMYEHAGGFEVTELSLLTYGAEWHMYPLGVPFGSQIAEDITAAVDAEKTRAMAAEATLTKKINTEAFERKNADAALDTRVTAIEDKIPAQATAENKLADKEFVNNSIATATATFRGTFSTLEALKATQADKNDYAFWAHKDEDGNTCYDKYTYTDTEWKFEYRLNNSSFTTAQWAALNSGVTADVIKALQDADKANAKAIADEKAAREQADTTLQGNINAENTRATTAEATLTKKINTEAFERKSADATLQDNIDKKQDIISDLATIRMQAATAYGWGDHSEAGYLTGITKAMVEGVLTGNITSHTHSYLPLSGGMMTNTDKVTNLNADLLDGYDASSFAKVASANNLISSNNEFIFVPSDFTGELYINPKTTGGANGAITKYHFCNGAHGVLATISQGQFSGNAASSSKWSTARTITLTGSVTGSVSFDGSGNVSLTTTTNHTHTFASLTDKPTTISGYGITDAYTKTETDSKVEALQSLLDSMFERVYDSNNKLIRIHSNVTISSSGDLVAGDNSEGGGTSGGAYTQLEWNAIKALTQSESGLLASAYAVKEAYNELNTAIETLAGKATNVKFTQTLTSGKQIGTISIDGKSTSLFAPANYAWSEITGKPAFATVATSGSYSDLSNKPTIASLMGSTAIGGASSYIYWNGSAWATKALGSNAFTSISKVSQLTNDSGYITGITKAMVEGALTGNITSHTHSYIPLADKGFSNGKVPYYVNFPNYNTLVSLGYNEDSTATEDEYYFKGLCKWAIDNFANQGYILLIGNAQPNSIGYCCIELYSNNGKDANTGLPQYCSGTFISLSFITTNFGCRNYIWNWGGSFEGNASTASKWANARTITLTGSVTGSVSIDGSANVSLATTTNHTHTFASLTDKPTTISGYGITDAYTASTIDSKLSGYLPLSGGILNVNTSIGFKVYAAISGGGGWALNVINLYDRAATKRFGGLGYYGDNLNLNCIYLGTGEYSDVNLRIYGTGQSDLKWGTNPILHSGNYNSYSPKLDGTGATGTWGINISGNAETAKNADTLDGVHYQNILERYYSGYSSSGTATGWFRIAETLITDDGGVTFLLAIQRGYSYTNNESYLFSISVSFGGGISITQLSGYANTRLITKIRVDWSHSQIAYVDLYIGSSSKTNDYFWYTVGCAKSYTTWTANPTLVGDAHEFTTVQGCKSDKGFTGYLTGTASSATKLQNSRTIWGQSFDGTGNVSGALTGVTSITASGHAKVYSLKTDHICIECDNSGNSSGRSSEINNYDGHIYLQHDTSHNCFICTGGGKVGIGTNNPSYKLHIVGKAYASENIIAAGDLTAGSDIRYKDKIQDLRLSVHDIALAPAFTYKWNNREDDALVHIGSSAQYWLNTNAKDAVYYDKQNDFYHLNYASLALCNTIILARGMETQEEKIARLEDRIKELEDKLRQNDSSR